MRLFASWSDFLFNSDLFLDTLNIGLVWWPAAIVLVAMKFTLKFHAKDCVLFKSIVILFVSDSI